MTLTKEEYKAERNKNKKIPFNKVPGIPISCKGCARVRITLRKLIRNGKKIYLCQKCN